MSIGSKLFPNIVSVDLDLKSRISPKEEKLVLAFVYLEEGEMARKYAARLQQRLKTIRKIPVSIRALPLSRLLHPPTVESSVHPSAIFVADKLTDTDVRQLLAFSESHHLVTFSPFVGDVQRGVMAGLYIGSRILPLINLTTMKRVGIRFHPMFLKLARHHE